MFPPPTVPSKPRAALRRARPGSREAGIRRIRPDPRKNTGFSGRHYVGADGIEVANRCDPANRESSLRPNQIGVDLDQAFACHFAHLFRIDLVPTSGEEQYGFPAWLSLEYDGLHDLV